MMQPADPRYTTLNAHPKYLRLLADLMDKIYPDRTSNEQDRTKRAEDFQKYIEENLSEDDAKTVLRTFTEFGRSRTA